MGFPMGLHTLFEAVDVHTLAEPLAAHLTLEESEVADAIVRQCDAFGARRCCGTCNAQPLSGPLAAICWGKGLKGSNRLWNALSEEYLLGGRRPSRGLHPWPTSLPYSVE